ncbi:hypothetical protein C5S31_06295 [ANME-1 cluster archaeon GoMg2]|nr:hypothetical protein [ANME-1 cluster archaeon GoMg2]
MSCSSEGKSGAGICPIADVFEKGACVRVERKIVLPDAIKYFDVIFCPLFDIGSTVTRQYAT